MRVTRERSSSQSLFTNRKIAVFPRAPFCGNSAHETTMRHAYAHLALKAALPVVRQGCLFARVYGASLRINRPEGHPPSKGATGCPLPLRQRETRNCQTGTLRPLKFSLPKKLNVACSSNED